MAAQFVRAVVATNSVDVWTYDRRASSATDPAFSGTLTDIGAGERRASASRPQARLQPYALSESTSKENGGSTSRIGADFFAACCSNNLAFRNAASGLL